MTAHTLPPDSAARPVTLPTARGPLALLDQPPSPGVDPRTPVLLVPGFTGSKEDFGAVLQPLAAAGHRAVAYDQRGQYESPGVDDPEAYAVPALAADLLDVVDWLAPDGAAVHLLGHSFGGLVARAAVLGRPQRVRSLVLLGSGPAAIGGARAERMQYLAPLLAAGGMPAVHQALEALEAGDPRAQARDAALRDFLRRRFLASSPVGLQGMGDALLTEPDRVEELRAAGVPVLVAYGADDDAWPPAVQAEMARRLGTEPVVIDGAAHSPAAEQPAALVAALTDFWATVERAG